MGTLPGRGSSSRMSPDLPPLPRWSWCPLLMLVAWCESWQPDQGRPHFQVGPGFHEGCRSERCCCHRDRLLVLHRGVHRQGQPCGLPSLNMDVWCSQVFTCGNENKSVKEKKKKKKGKKKKKKKKKKKS